MAQETLQTSHVQQQLQRQCDEWDETDEHGYAKECEYSTGKWTRKAWSAYNYFHSYTRHERTCLQSLQKFLDDWRKSKAELLDNYH